MPQSFDPPKSVMVCSFTTQLRDALIFKGFIVHSPKSLSQAVGKETTVVGYVMKPSREGDFAKVTSHSKIPAEKYSEFYSVLILVSILLRGEVSIV